jgi:hypothetical protein
LWLGRPKPRRAWLGKGLVLAVLAIGSLAYAKPQAARELVELARGRDGAAEGKRLMPGVAVLAPVQAALHAAAIANASGTQARDVDVPRTPQIVTVPADASLAKHAGRRATTASQTEKAAAAAAASAQTSAAQTKTGGLVSDWGRVGHALASGDSSEALAALGELSESEDPRTRDKADLGRAQLLMARGEAEQACVLARSLTQRRAGGRIERQAQLLLKNCPR